MGSKVIDSSQMGDTILAVLPKFIGDAINTLPALELLKKLYPTKRICVLIRPFMAGLFSRAEHYGLELILDKRYCDKAQYGVFDMIRELKSYNFSMAILFRGSFRDALQIRLSGIKTIVGYAQNARSPLLSHALKLNQCEHYIHRYCKLINDPHGQPFKQFNAPTLQPKKLKSFTFNKRNVALYLGGSVKGARFYPQDLSQELLLRIKEQHDANLYLLGAQSEQADMDSLKCDLERKGVTVINLAGSMSLEELVDTIGMMDVMISIDSGPMHIAAACNIPCIAIIGQGTSPWSIVAPKSDSLIALHHRSMSFSDSQMIRDVNPDKICQALQKAINSSN
ncbi:glycosyltransferase family 9 protein [Pseudoalteromonas luteoviolacea]|uniref:glycosyltransferase family 9 protein n=1 Tax=Pseudoalteromonas luteoviolacea TaxID=43657 RepID=UPI001B35DCAC|nr:glycosyltransferase family 9 protein [Pseudoalteromonas luteoviolacea]MBQ4837773.1 glycosyltransferase family 9 protein [Pseudoalteromonas luteoviolacea]